MDRVGNRGNTPKELPWADLSGPKYGEEQRQENMWETGVMRKKFVSTKVT